MEFDLNLLLIIIPFIFLGGFVDAIAGGGGVIIMTAFMVTGVPMHYAIGTNKSQALFGTAVATFNYIKNGCFRKDFILFSIIGSLIGAALGSSLAIILSDQTLRIAMTIILPIVSFIVITGKKPKINLSEESKKHVMAASFLIGLGVGFYDGVLGPGAGTFYIIAFTMCGLTVLEANGNAKIVNLTSNIVAASLFLLKGKVLLWLIIPCIIASILSNYLGSKLAIKNGEKIVKPIMVMVLILLFIKTISDIIL